MNQRKPRIFNSAPPPEAGADSWYRINNAAGDDASQPLEIELYDEIGGWGIRAVDFLRDLKAADDGQRDIIVAINSLGGDVFDGIAIHNTLRRLGNRVTVRIDSVAASIASVIAAGAHQVVMPENAMLMIHNPWTVTWGEADDLRATADMMDKVRANLIACYRAKAPALEEAELIKMLDDTTWLTAQEAVALGLADVIADTVPLKASAAMRAGLGRLKNAPPALLKALEQAPPKNEPPVDPPANPDPEPQNDPKPDPVALARLATRLCNEAGLSAVAVDSVVAASSLGSEPAVRAGVERAVTIRDLCKTAKLPELADSLMASGLDVEAARSRLFDKLVANAGDELDNTPPEPEAAPPKAGPNPRQIYQNRQVSRMAAGSTMKPQAR
ncbi:MAG: ATP-dependent Clp protease proteolytic subunit [Pseudogulbenkiania sp.]|nr:ATP-dependent Clp protease proteolytic subunit [Pseudogulbenkiania sp.]